MYLIKYYSQGTAWNIDDVSYFSATGMLFTVSHSRNLRRNIPVFALLNSPIDMIDINFCSV